MPALTDHQIRQLIPGNMTAELDSLSLAGRPPGRLVTILARLVPGVAAVRAQEVPYAQAWRQTNLKSLAGENVRWVVFGDSMSQGLGASSLSQSWVSQLARSLLMKVDVVNLSETGARVSDVMSRQVPVWRALPPAPHGEIVTLLIGSNDLFHPGVRGHLPVQFAELIRLLPDEAIVATLPSPRRLAGGVNAVIEAARIPRSLRVVNSEALGGSWRGRLAADHFHPNDHGYAAIARMFEPAVTAAISNMTEDDQETSLPRHGRRDG
jgi:lysophospholipase L1-like esterase